MRSIRPPTRGLRAGLVALAGVGALLAVTIAPVAAAEPGPTSVPALSGLVTDACTGLPITAGLSVGVAALVADPTTGQVDPGPVQSPSSQGLGLFSYRTLQPGPIQLTVTAFGYTALGADPTRPPGPANLGPGVTVTKDPGPVNLPPGQGLAVGLLLDIRLAPAYTGGPCKPPNPNFPAIAGRGIDSATGRGLRGLTVGVAPLIADPTTGLLDPGPIQVPSGAPILGLFSFRDPGPTSFQFYAAAPGHTSLGADPTKPPGPTNLGPGVTVTKDPGPIALPPGSGSVSVSLVLSVMLPLSPNDFSIAASPASQNLTAGSTVSFTVATAVTRGVSEAVAISTLGEPSGVTASYNPASVSAGGSATIVLSASPGSVNGPHVITVVGTAASGVHTAQVTVIISGGTSP